MGKRKIANWNISFQLFRISQRSQKTSVYFQIQTNLVQVTMNRNIFRVSQITNILSSDNYIFQLLIIHGMMLTTTPETFFDKVEELDLFNQPLKLGYQSLENHKHINDPPKASRKQLLEIENV